jgi:IS5 family transposase
MYRRPTPGQLSFENFYLPFGGKFSSENRWVKLSQLIPWEELEAQYADQFSKGMGAPAKPFRMALGALIIKERLGTSDEETVEQIRENPYLQYFIGCSQYCDQAPFDASMMVHFRKRLSLEIVGQINEQIVKQAVSAGQSAGELKPEPPSRNDNAQQELDSAHPSNQGQLIVDASCAPADIRYPTDLSLLNEAREQTEAIIDLLYEQVQDRIEKKPRTYRKQARRDYLSVIKQRKARGKTRRKAIRRQLGYVRRNLGHIDALVAAGASLSLLDAQRYRKLLVISELLRQQQCMYEQCQHRIEDRIVSLSQPHIRPIVRGKAGTPVEFGAKISLSCVKGMVFLDHLSWDNFNESGDLPQQVEQFKQRYGHYPEAVLSDQIYRTRANRDYCQQRGIRLSGKPLGRPVLAEQAGIRQQAQADGRTRNQIEGKFGQAKRRFTLNRVMAKLAPTAQTTIAITVLVMNLEQLLRQLLFVFFTFLFKRWQSWIEHKQRQSARWQHA